MKRLALVPPTLRAIRRGPVLGAMATGLAFVAVPAALTVTLRTDNLAVLLRLGMACAAVGIAFLFDDPAKPTTATVPAPAWHSLAIRATTAAAAMSAWWAAAVAITLTGAEDGTGDALPLPGLALEAAAVGAVALAAATLAWRLTPRGHASPAAAPAVLVVFAALAFAPQRAAVFVSVAAPDWDAAHHRLTLLLAACLVVAAAAAALHPPRRPPPTPRPTSQAHSSAHRPTPSTGSSTSPATDSPADRPTSATGPLA
ncbi:hypothetical protein [Dactylosporangium sp. NPDC005555]|uniref:hypothetical protein n=1 Tax=Dactylosporangium sp. NPDC005555 TaxID=3154889 RepID=UPI0033BAB686